MSAWWRHLIPDFQPRFNWHKYILVFFFEIHEVGNIGIIANFVFWHICSLPCWVLGDYDASKCEIIYQWVWENCILKLYSPLVQLFSNGIAKMKLAMLPSMCWDLFRRNYVIFQTSLCTAFPTFQFILLVCILRHYYDSGQKQFCV